jgi:DNA-binding FadR family transcriptional regulator
MADASANEPAPVPAALGRNLTFGLLDAVGRAVVVGDYEGKPFPTEADLAQQYGVSRSVTREALKMLAAKGLLGARPKQGTFVRPQEHWNLFDTDLLRWLLDRKFSVALLRQFNELRVGVEPQAARLAARRARPAQVAAIAAGLQRMRDAEQGLDDALEADIEFHVAILRASGNPFYIQFRDIVGTALRTSIRFTNRIAGRTASIADHAAVHAAIAGGNEDAAFAAMRNLIDDVLDLIESTEGGPAAE